MSKAEIQLGRYRSPYARRGQMVRIAYVIISAIYWLLTRLAGRPRGIVVLCYHSVRTDQLQRFTWQMRHTARRAVSPSAVASGRRASGGSPYICVTFDDGFENVLKNALPAMQALGVPATLFVVPGSFGTVPAWGMPAGHPDRAERVPSGSELAAAARRGLCSIGSHTFSHVRLSQAKRAEMMRELSDSKEALEELLDCEIVDLAFPYGDYDATTVERAYSSGYRRLFTLDPRLWHPEKGETLVGRFLVCPEMWRVEFALTCAGAYAWRAASRRVWQRLRPARQRRAAGAPEVVAT